MGQRCTRAIIMILRLLYNVLHGLAGGDMSRKRFINSGSNSTGWIILEKHQNRYEVFNAFGMSLLSKETP